MTDKTNIIEILSTTTSRWISELQNLFKISGKDQYEEQDKLLFSSSSVFENYLNNTLLIIKNGSRLPAEVLLRALGEFIIRLKWCMESSTRKQSGRTNKRFESWRIHSLKELNRFRKSVVDKYDGNEKKELEQLIETTEQEINDAQVNDFPQIKNILYKIYEKKSDQILSHGAMYLRFLRASHIDLITISETMKSDIHFFGDRDTTGEILVFDCLAFAHLYLEGLYRYYDYDFKSIDDEYSALMKKHFLEKDFDRKDKQ